MSAKISFIYLGISQNRFNGAEYHLGSEYIRTYLASFGIPSSRLVSDARITMEQLADHALDTGATVCAFTCYDNNYYLNRLLAEKIKKASPETTIIFGGPSATFSDCLILNNCRAVDICVRGEGEETVRELMEVSTKEVEHVCGISFRQGGRIIRTPDRPPVSYKKGSPHPLDFFPSPYLSGTIPDNVCLGILSSRGCPYSCTYCNFAAMSSHRIRTHSVERILQELESILQGMGNLTGRKINFTDDTFTFYPERTKNICKGMIERRLNRVDYFCETRADKVDEELLHLMREAGFSEINFGLESADPLVLNRCRKLRNTGGEADNFKMEQDFIKNVEQTVSLSHRIGLNPSVSIILGLPGETPESAERTLDMVRRLQVKTYYHNHLTLYPGTELFQKARQLGIQVKKSPYTLPYYTRPSYDTYAVKQIENSVTVNRREVTYQERNIRYFHKVTGIPNNNDNLTILFYRLSQIKPSDLVWMESIFPLSAELGWISSTAAVQAEDFIKTLVQTGFPCVHPLLLLPAPGFPKKFLEKYVWADYLYKTDYPDKTDYPVSYPVFYIVPFSATDRLNISEAHKENAIFLYTITENRDYLKFIKLIQYLTGKMFHTLPKELINRRFSFLDECRWAPLPCPAGNLSRIVVHDDHRLTSCITGGCIGRVGEDIGKIKKRLQSLKEKEEKLRGCDSCPVRRNCSRCLFPVPIDRDEFCRIQQTIFPPQAMRIFSQLRTAYRFQTLPRDLFFSFYSNLPPKSLQAIERITKALHIRQCY